MSLQATSRASTRSVCAWTAFCLYSLLAGAAEAQWTRGAVTDPATLESVEAASVGNDDGARFAVYRAPGGASRILGAFYLAGRDQDFLDTARAPTVSVDGAPPSQLVRLSGELKSVGFLLWPGPGEPTVGLLRDLMTGSRMTVGYPLSGGGFKEATFDLEGAREIIAAALGIAPEVSPEARALAEVQEAAVDECFELPKKKQREKCMKALAACGARQLESAADLEACIAEVR